MIGKSLSHYQIISLIGKGGMGEVYQARDQKLGRDVAIKVLPEEFAKEAERVARFQREAKLLASLNHPNIAAIHGLEEDNDTHFLVLELVEGQTLAERIKAGPVDVEEALKLGLQIAEALEAAHEKGVIHRDLKPANIMVSPEGKVKVLDFGLAKAFKGDPSNLNLSNSPTLSDTATMQGVILGTAAYMPPEQAKGRTVDKRADIWAFGVVLFEMLTGRQVFTGETVSEILASVFKSEPEWQSLPPNLHSRIRFLLERCLQKEPKNRCSSISDARVDIQNTLADRDGVLIQPVSTAKSRKKLELVIPCSIAVILIALIAWLISLNMQQSDTSTHLRFPLDLDLPDESSVRAPLAIISPDGRQIATVGEEWTLEKAIAAGRRVWTEHEGIRLFNFTEMDSSPVQLISSNIGTVPVAFSPDGQWIAARAYSTIKPPTFLDARPDPRSKSLTTLEKIPITKGSLPVPQFWRKVSTSGGVTWEEDGSLLFCQSGEISRIPEGKTNAETLLKLAEGEICGTPQLLPGGEWVLFSVKPDRLTPWTYATVAIQSIISDERRILFPRGRSPRYVPTGHVVFIRGNNLYGVPFNLETMQVQGEPLQILDRVRTTDATADYNFSNSGSLVYLSGEVINTPLLDLSAPTVDKFTIIDRKGTKISSPLSRETRKVASFRLSPNGRQVAVPIRETEGNKSETHIWIFDIANEYGRQLTYGSEANHDEPVWTADGKSIVYLSHEDDGSKVFQKAADGINEPEMLYHSSSEINSLDMSPDETLIFRCSDALWTFNPESDDAPSELPFSGWSPRFSPDGKRVAYISRETIVYVRPYPKTDTGQIRISIAEGYHPVWSSDGNTIFYISQRDRVRSGVKITFEYMIQVRVQTEPTFVAEPRVELFTANLDLHSFEVFPQSDRFMYPEPVEQSGQQLTEILESLKIPIRAYLIPNWFEELKQRVPVK